MRIRNATTTTIAPTGTISMIADVSSGIEPHFAISFVKNVLDDEELYYVNKHFEKIAKKRGFYSKELMKKIAEQYLPETIVHREKQGFILPLDNWMRGTLKPYFDSVFSEYSVTQRGIFHWEIMKRIYERFLTKGEGCFQVWNLAMLELWLRVHLDGTSPL